MTQAKPDSHFEKVYVSYNWKTEEQHPVVKNFQQWCEQNNASFSLIREKDELEYKAHIDRFMQKIAENWCVIAVISKRYMRSLYCMTELLKTWEQGEFDRRLLPLQINNYWPNGDEQAELTWHWKEQVEKYQGVETEQAKGIRKIREKLPDLLDALDLVKADAKDGISEFESIAALIQQYQEEETHKKEQLDEIREYKRKAEALIKEKLQQLPFKDRFEDSDHFCKTLTTREAITTLFNTAHAYTETKQHDLSAKLEVYQTWQTVNDIMGWRVILAVDENKLGNTPAMFKYKDMLCYEIPIKGDIATEIFAALKHGNRAQFRADPSKRRSTTGHGNLNSELPANGWGDDAFDEVYKAIWKNVFHKNKETFTPDDIEELNEELEWQRESAEGRTIYFSVDKKEEDHPLNKPEVLEKLLDKKTGLSNLIVIIKDTDSEQQLFDSREARLLPPIRSFVLKTYELNPNNEPGSPQP